MALNTSDISFSPKDRIKGLSLPTRLNTDLAYLCGVMAGDGSINVRLHKHDYEIKIVGNPKDEKEFYIKVISPIFKDIFSINLIPNYFDKKTTYGIRTHSKALVEFFTEILKLPKGNKYSKLKIPPLIKSNPKFTSAFIQGVADTDFCISLKKRNRRLPYYPVISGVSKSKKFIDEIAEELISRGLIVAKRYNQVQKDVRFKKGYAVTHRIDLSGNKQLINWMKVIGFKSPKHLNKVELWKIQNNIINIF